MLTIYHDQIIMSHLEPSHSHKLFFMLFCVERAGLQMAAKKFPSTDSTLPPESSENFSYFTDLCPKYYSQVLLKLSDED